jgi:hypothetical protein
LSEPTVDVVIPVHSDARPIYRAVSSVLAGTVEPVQVTVVCHNIDPALIRSNLGELVEDDRVRTLHLDDGIPSPAGPINFGLDSASAAFTALLDSDDTYETGAIDSWMRLQRASGADVVIAPLKYVSGGTVRTPTRPFRSQALDGVRDRLAYRTRQHGLVARELFENVRMTAGLRTGEDIEQGLRLWFSGARISFDRKGPGYLIHEDFDDRASVVPKSVEEDFAFLETILAPGWGDLSARAREAIGVKLLRTHVMEALVFRFLSDHPVIPEEQRALAGTVNRILDFAPTSATVVSRRDRRILASVLDGVPSEPRLRADLAVRANYLRPDNLMSASLARVLHREAPLRFLGALVFAA